MACFLVNTSSNLKVLSGETTSSSSPLLVSSSSYIAQLLAVATNSWVYKENQSDVHAEVNAVATAARCGVKTDQSCAYITMPPCKNCFCALVQAGICRIVSRFPAVAAVQTAAGRLGVELVVVPDNDIRRVRREAFVRQHGRLLSQSNISELAEMDEKRVIFLESLFYLQFICVDSSCNP